MTGASSLLSLQLALKTFFPVNKDNEKIIKIKTSGVLM